MPPNTLSSELKPSREALPPFEILYDCYHTQVYRYLYAHLKDEHNAVDLMQQIFFQAWNKGHTYEPKRGTIATWLLSIAHHKLVDFYRTSRPSISWESMPETPAMDLDPEARIISEETITQVKKILEVLPPPEQELLALRFGARLSSAEIASIIGKSEAATKKQLTRLLHRLQEQYRLQESEELLPDLLEPTLPAFIAALHQAYTFQLSHTHLYNSRKTLLERIHSTLLRKDEFHGKD